MSDANLATLGLVVDPSGMESGVARGVSALQRMISSAMATEAAMKNVRSGLDVFSTSGSGMENAANRSSSALGAMAEKLKALAAVTRFASDSLNVVRGVFDGLSGAWGWLSGFVDAGAQVERFETQFAGLTGSFDKAKTLLGQIREYANKSPFEFPESAQAARTLYSLTQGMEDVPKLLLTVGDAAAQGGQSLTQTAETLGRLYSTIKLGSGFDDPLRTLGQNGVISPQLVRTVTTMVQSGKDAHEIWAKVLDDLARNNGASERLSRTYEGLTCTLHDAYDTLQQAFGRPISDALKAPVRDFGAWLGSQDGIAAKFGVALGDGVKQLYGAFRTGQLSAYLKQEFDVAVTWLRGKWDAFASWAGDVWTRYISDPFKAAHFGDGLLSLASDFKDLIIYGFELGANRLRASLTIMVQEFKGMLSGVSIMGAHIVDPATVGSQKYRDVVSGLDAEIKKPTLHMQPFIDGLVGATRSLLGLEQGAKTIGGYSAGYGGWGNVAAGGSTMAGLMTGTRSYVFGTDMDGAPDRSAQKDFPDHPEWRNHGAYNNTDLTNPNLLGAAVSPTQATELTGIADENKAIAAILGQMLQISYGQKTAQAQVVDIAPVSNKGIELTPAAHRAVGDTRGDAPISFGLAGGQTTVDMKKIMDAATVSQVGAGNGITTVADALEAATAKAAGFGVKIVDGSRDVQAFNANMKLLDLQVRLYNQTQGKAGLSEQQANAIRLQARDGLAKSSASYKQLAATLGEAAAKQAAYNQRAAEAKEKMGYNTLGAGASMRQGATDWAKAQGTSDQQYYKLMGDSLDTLTNRSTDLFSSMAEGSKSAGQAFKDFAVGMMQDIAKLIIKLLVLKAVQMLVGSFGGGGASFGTMHRGGTVGFGASGSTTVHPLAYLGAPRFHGGGMLGLGPDEVPIIAQTGERVLNRRETMEYNRGERASRGSSATYHRGGDTSFNMPITINSNGGNGAAGGKDPLADPAFAKTFHKRMQGVAREEIMRANNYRGINNPG